MPTTFTLSGLLEEIPLPDVARLIQAARRTGHLAATADKFAGTIFFERGKIVEVLSTSLSGLDALKSLALLTSGTFGWVDGGTSPSQVLENRPTGDLIRIWEERVQEVRQIQELMPGIDDNIHYLGGTLPAGFEVSAAELAVVMRAGTPIKVNDLATELRIDEILVRYTAARFRAAGLLSVEYCFVERKEAPRVKPPPLPPSSPAPPPVTPPPPEAPHADPAAPRYWRGRRID